MARQMFRLSRRIPILDVRSPLALTVSVTRGTPFLELPGALAGLNRHRVLPVGIVEEEGEEGRTVRGGLSGKEFKHAPCAPEGVAGILAGGRVGLDIVANPIERA